MRHGTAKLVVVVARRGDDYDGGGSGVGLRWRHGSDGIRCKGTSG